MEHNDLLARTIIFDHFHWISKRSFGYAVDPSSVSLLLSWSFGYNWLCLVRSRASPLFCMILIAMIQNWVIRLHSPVTTVTTVWWVWPTSTLNSTLPLLKVGSKSCKMFFFKKRTSEVRKGSSRKPLGSRGHESGDYWGFGVTWETRELFCTLDLSGQTSKPKSSLRKKMNFLLEIRTFIQTFQQISKFLPVRKS